MRGRFKVKTTTSEPKPTPVTDYSVDPKSVKQICDLYGTFILGKSDLGFWVEIPKEVGNTIILWQPASCACKTAQEAVAQAIDNYGVI
jgi:hypothetical protein